MLSSQGVPSCWVGLRALMTNLSNNKLSLQLAPRPLETFPTQKIEPNFARLLLMPSPILKRQIFEIGH